MKLRCARIWCLRIPFVEAFAHSAMDRRTSDTVVIRIEADDGTVGYGEGAPRPYVTGESVNSMLRRVSETLWPAMREAMLPLGTGPELLKELDCVLGNAAPSDQEPTKGILAHHAARCAMELALLDCYLKRENCSLATLLPPRTKVLCYGGVIPSGSVDKALRYGRRMKRFGLSHFKIKVGDEAGIERVGALRKLLGPEASIRVDANGVWSLDEALHQLEALAGHGVESCEEPIGRERMNELPDLCRRSPIPIMLDESLVSLDEARWLAELGACHQFNLRVSKCGGIARTLAFVDLARTHGIGFQIGAHVGETSLLSAAGRHLAAALPDLRYLEGSFGTLLLAEDVADPSLCFGHLGRAPLLKGLGLGVQVQEERLNRYAEHVKDLS